MRYLIKTNGEKFPIGNVQKVKEFLKSRGFGVAVSAKTANVALVPDGTSRHPTLPTESWSEMLTRQPVSKIPESKITYEIEAYKSRIDEALIMLSKNEQSESTQTKKSFMKSESMILKKLANPDLSNALLFDVPTNMIGDLYAVRLMLHLKINELFEKLNKELKNENFQWQDVIDSNQCYHESWKEFQKDYYSTNSTNLYLLLIKMQISLRCKSKELRDEIIKWASDFLFRFLSCEDFSESDCTDCCFWQHGSCHDKPMLLVFDNLIRAVCITDNVSAKKYVVRQLTEIYFELFGVGYDSSQNECLKLLQMWADIRTSINANIPHSIQWSQVSDFLDIDSQTWIHLWLGTTEQRKSSFLEISKLQESDDFQNIVRKIAIVIANVM